MKVKKNNENLKNYSRLKHITTKYIAHKGKISLNDIDIGLRQGVRDPDACVRTMGWMSIFL
jgi:hypothetical protein